MSSCSKMPDILNWYEKEGSLDAHHVAGCPDCQKEKESLRVFYEATQELKKPLIPKDIERRLEHLSAAHIIMEATRRSLNFWTTLAKIEAVGLLLMGLSLLFLLGKIRPEYPIQPQNMKSLSLPAENIQQSGKTQISENPTQQPSVSANTQDPKDASSKKSEKETSNSVSSEKNTLESSENMVSQNSSPPQEEAQEEANKQEPQTIQNEPEIQTELLQKLKKENTTALLTPVEADHENQPLDMSESAVPSENKDLSDISIDNIGKEEVQNSTLNESMSENNSASSSAEPESMEHSLDENTLPESEESQAGHSHEETSETGHEPADENTSDYYSRVLESTSDALNSPLSSGSVVVMPISNANQRSLTASQNALSRSRPAVGSQWYPGMAKMLPVFLGNGYILDKSEGIHPFFKPALDEMEKEGRKKDGFSKSENPSSKKPFISDLSFKDALKNNDNLNIPPYESDEEGPEDKKEINAPHSKNLDPQNQVPASEWKTDIETETVKNRKFDRNPAISKEALNKLDPKEKNKPQKKFHPPKDKGPKPPGGKVPKFGPGGKAPFGKAPLPPGGKGPPPPGGN